MRKKTTWGWLAFLGLWLLAASGCNNANLDILEQQDTGTARVTIEFRQPSSSTNALAYFYEIASVKIDVQPADVHKVLTRDQAGESTYTIEVTLPVGTHTIYATAYDDYDDEIGQGEVEVTITLNQTTEVFLSILDTTGSPGLPDNGPVILLVTASKTNPVVGESIDLYVQAMDMDDDPIEYLWSDDCASSAFTAPEGSETSWSSSVDQSCTITITAMSGELSDEEEIFVTVFPAGTQFGTADLTAGFVSHPYIHYLEFYGSSNPTESFGYQVYRRDSEDILANAMISDPIVPGSNPISIFGSMIGENLGDGQVSVTDDCGGTVDALTHEDSDFSLDWYPPPMPGLCTLSFKLEYMGLEDVFPVAMYLAEGYEGDGPPDDEPEP